VSPIRSVIRMTRALTALTQLPAPLVALLYLGLWIGAEIGRGVTGLALMVIIALAIGVSRVSWIASTTLLALGLLLASVHAVVPFGATDWPAYAGIAYAAGLGWSRPGRSAWIPSAIAGVLLFWAAGLMVANGWLSWTGGYGIMHLGWFGEWAALAALGLLLLVPCCLIGWGVGLVEREVLTDRIRLVQQVAERDHDLRLADERNRIAQEMHDVVAHSLAVIVAQADGARYLEKARPAAMADALESIATAARTALVDVRGMIDGIVDGTEPPQPDLDGLPELIDTVRDTGLDVTLTEAGERGPLGPGQQGAVYRIVQEGLTNALRHRGRGSHADVVLDWRGPGLSIQLVSRGEGERSAETTAGSGRGIPGMAERARLAGGWLAAGSDDSGDHRITAFVPYREAHAIAPVPVAAAA
jgi:signal transduction histidine kinase